MKMVAAAKLRRAQTNVLSARPYAEKIRDLAQRLADEVDDAPRELMAARPVRHAAVVVVTSDRGLCGAFNTNLIRAAVNHMQQTSPGAAARGNMKVFCVGRKGSDFFPRRHYDVGGKYVGVYSHLVFATAKEIAGVLVAGFLRGDFDRVDILYNEFKSVTQQRIVADQFLPMLPEPAQAADTGRSRRILINYIFEPSGREILGAVVPKQLCFQIWRILLESNAAEQGARMVAMDNATENANEMIDHLQLQYNKARQASITKELLEVVSGAEALSHAE